MARAKLVASAAAFKEYLLSQEVWIGLAASLVVFVVVGLILFKKKKSESATLDRPVSASPEKLTVQAREPLKTPLPTSNDTQPRSATTPAEIRPSEAQASVRSPTSTTAPAPRTLPPEAPKSTPQDRTARGLSKTKHFFQSAFDRMFSSAQGEKFFDDLEEVLLTSDLGVQFSETAITRLRSDIGIRIPARNELKDSLQKLLLSAVPPAHLSTDSRPRVVLIVGVNGAGKTTTIAKLCSRFQSEGKQVLVGAADTFRAAATEQLKTWVERVGAHGVFQKEGADPSAVAFDSVQAAINRQADICLIDTAGRLHTKVNLMEELKKMKRVVAKALPGAPHDVWLVLDGTTGQNALIQAKEFHQHLGLTGLVVTKLDGSAKGGAALAIASELRVPIVFIGVGETPEDLLPFDPQNFVQEILAGL